MSAEDRDLPVPELDDLGLRVLLSEVTDRVEGVARLANRLQGLLQAVVAIGSHLDIATVLHEIVTTAAEVADAKYAAIGVLDPRGERRLSQFITVGVDAAQQARIGELPSGHGVLGLLIDDPQPIRLAEHRRPSVVVRLPGQPPLRCTRSSACPVLIRGEVYGNLYLTEKRGGGEFTAADERLVMALATAAGLAVQNARLYEQAERRQQWLEASRDITTMLLGGSTAGRGVPPADRLRPGDGRRGLGVPRAPARGRKPARRSRGRVGAEQIRGTILPEQSMSARVMDDSRPIAVSDARSDGRIWQTVIEAAGAGPALFVPLGTAESTVGTLVVTNRCGGPSFPDDTITLIESIAGQAAFALRLGAVAKDREQLAVLGDRDRIARDLHDLVIQRLFATGMSLEGALRGMQPAPSAERVHRAVDDLDTTIKEIRSTIFALQSPAPFAGEGLRTAIDQAARSAERRVGLRPARPHRRTARHARPAGGRRAAARRPARGAVQRRAACRGDRRHVIRRGHRSRRHPHGAGQRDRAGTGRTAQRPCQPGPPRHRPRRRASTPHAVSETGGTLVEWSVPLSLD